MMISKDNSSCWSCIPMWSIRVNFHPTHLRFLPIHQMIFGAFLYCLTDKRLSWILYSKLQFTIHRAKTSELILVKAIILLTTIYLEVLMSIKWTSFLTIQIWCIAWIQDVKIMSLSFECHPRFTILNKSFIVLGVLIIVKYLTTFFQTPIAKWHSKNKWSVDFL